MRNGSKHGPPAAFATAGMHGERSLTKDRPPVTLEGTGALALASREGGKPPACRRGDLAWLDSVPCQAQRDAPADLHGIVRSKRGVWKNAGASTKNDGSYLKKCWGTY